MPGLGEEIAAAGNVLAQGKHLHLQVLLGGGHPGIQSNAHRLKWRATVNETTWQSTPKPDRMQGLFSIACEQRCAQSLVHKHPDGFREDILTAAGQQVGCPGFLEVSIMEVITKMKEAISPHHSRP